VRSQTVNLVQFPRLPSASAVIATAFTITVEYVELSALYMIKGSYYWMTFHSLYSRYQNDSDKPFPNKLDLERTEHGLLFKTLNHHDVLFLRPLI
jgi:hypothetical protein